MSDAEIRELIRQLPPEARELLERILRGEVSPGDVYALILAILDIAKNNELVRRIVIELVRRGQLPARILQRLLIFLGLPSAEAAGGGTVAGGGAAAAGGGAAATAVVALIALVAIGIAVYRIRKELVATPDSPQGGTPCTGAPAMATAEYAVTGRSVLGGVAAFEAAMAKARKHCMTLASKCTGDCGADKLCLPNVSVQTSVPHSYVVFSSVDLTFRCPCECIEPPPPED